MSVTIADPHEQLADALVFVSKQRHHRDCHCNSWRDASGQGFCRPEEATWNRAVNTLLDRIRGTQ